MASCTVWETLTHFFQALILESYCETFAAWCASLWKKLLSSKPPVEFASRRSATKSEWWHSSIYGCCCSCFIQRFCPKWAITTSTSSASLDIATGKRRHISVKISPCAWSVFFLNEIEQDWYKVYFAKKLQAVRATRNLSRSSRVFENGAM